MFSTEFEILLFCVTLITICIQFYVLYLIRRKSPPNMNEYQFFLIMLTFWDIIFSAMFGLFLQPYPLAESLSAAIRGFSIYFGDYAPLWTTCAVVYAGINVIVSQNHALLYRYFILYSNRSTYIIFMSKSAKFIYVLQAQFVALALCIFFYQTFVPPSDISQVIATLPLTITINLQPNEKLLLINGHGQIARVFFITLLTLFVTSEFVCFLLIYMILSALKRKSNGFSKLTYKLHIQFTMLLTAQLMTPLIFVFGPVAAYALTALFDKVSTQFNMGIGLMFLALYGTTNSLLTILFIGPYRVHAFNNLIRPWLRIIFNFFGIKSKLLSEKQSIPGSVITQQYQLSNVDRSRRGSIFVLPYK